MEKIMMDNRKMEAKGFGLKAGKNSWKKSKKLPEKLIIFQTKPC
jgi:hypothetical protein